MKTISKIIKDIFSKFQKPDLRECCRKEYGDDFVRLYDMINQGQPIGNFEETIIFLDMVEKVRHRI